MRSALITACMLLGTYVPATGVHPLYRDAPAQAQAAPPPRQAHADRDRDRDEGTPRTDVRQGNTSVAAGSAVAPRRAQFHRPLDGPATDAQLQQPGNRQLPGATMALLLALALLNGAGAAPPAISQPESKPWMRVTVDVTARD
jgi:hypothetical protein